MSDGNSGVGPLGVIGYCEALNLLLIALKLCNLIDWSWWWVMAPLWLPVAAVLAIALIGALVRLIGEGLE